MTKLTASLAIDSVMLVAFGALQSWRMTGVPAHEWLGLTFLLLALTHLVIHGRWVESRAPKLLRAGSLRGRASVALNLLLGIAMTVAITSGVFMSKVLLPNHLTSAAYGSWHSLHEQSSNLSLVLVGLHVALNWDLIAGGIRRALRERIRGDALLRPGIDAAVAVRRLAWIIGSAAVLTLAVWRLQPLVPAPGQITFVYPDGRRELGPLPADLPKLHRGTTHPDLANGTPKFVIALLAVGVVAVAGRKVLRLRLE
jgi:cytochrome b561